MTDVRVKIDRVSSSFAIADRGQWTIHMHMHHSKTHMMRASMAVPPEY